MKADYTAKKHARHCLPESCIFSICCCRRARPHGFRSPKTNLNIKFDQQRDGARTPVTPDVRLYHRAVVVAQEATGTGLSVMLSYQIDRFSLQLLPRMLLQMRSDMGDKPNS